MLKSSVREPYYKSQGIDENLGLNYSTQSTALREEKEDEDVDKMFTQVQRFIDNTSTRQNSRSPVVVSSETSSTVCRFDTGLSERTSDLATPLRELWLPSKWELRSQWTLWVPVQGSPNFNLLHGFHISFDEAKLTNQPTAPNICSANATAYNSVDKLRSQAARTIVQAANAMVIAAAADRASGRFPV